MTVYAAAIVCGWIMHLAFRTIRARLEKTK